MLNSYESMSEFYMHSEAETMSSRYLWIRTMSKDYKNMTDGYMLYLEVVISTDKLEGESEKNPLQEHL
jgi:hypothetical protein